MPRTERLVSKTGIYHIMLRGINQQLIFEETEDHTKFLSVLSEVKQISGFKLYAYCLMGNHVHLLIKEGDETIAQVFRRIGARYAFWFNWKYGRHGHLFQDRFRSEPVESDEYLLTVLLYIYQNPIKAGICKALDKYEWCSRKYLGKCGMVDESDLFKIVPIEVIEERECVEIDGDLLEPKIGRGRAMTDEGALKQLKVLSNVRSISEFQLLNRELQAMVLLTLKDRGVSGRQLARVSGLSRGLVMRICRDESAI